MKLARALAAGVIAGSVSVFIGVMFVVCLMGAYGSAISLHMFTEQPVSRVVISLLPALLIGAFLGLVVLTPYSVYRDRRSASNTVDIIACLTVPAILAIWGFAANYQSHVKRHPDALFTLLCLMLMALGGLVGFLFFRGIMGKPVPGRPSKIV